VKRVETYGARLVENVVQAVCRDLMAGALVELERRGVPVVLHVHDEIVAEVDGEEGLAEVIQVMETLPEWARGMPLKAEGHLSDRYGKE